jgi:integrase/recombinase XerD
VDSSIDQMAQDLARAEYAKDTQKKYVEMIVRLRDRLGKPIATWSRDDVRGVVEWLGSLGKSARWLTHRYCALKFLFTRTLGTPEMVSFLKLPKVYAPLPTVLSLDEVHALLRAIREPRYQAIAMVMYGAGLRIAEALALETRDIDGARGVLIVRHGKGNKAREAKLSSSLYEWLREYWARTRPPEPHLFSCPKRGTLPKADTVRAALSKAAKEAWIKKHVTPHVLRHSFATHLLDEGTDVHVVRQLLGHASINSTARYARVTQKRVRETPSPLDLLPQRRR